jgi:hypothetical protein
MAEQHEALTSATALIDVMLDDEHTDGGPDAGWSAMNQRFSDWLDGENLDAQQKRQSIDVLLRSDLQAEIAEEACAAGGTPALTSSWFRRDFARSVGTLPSTGLFRELLHEKHLNKGSRWEPNDLTDMVYLACAAGYADIVVCERFTAAALSRGQKRLSRAVNSYPTLHAALPALEAIVGPPSRPALPTT